MKQGNLQWIFTRLKDVKTQQSLANTVRSCYDGHKQIGRFRLDLPRLLEGKTMAYQISDDCISCGACQAECPVDAISEGDGKYVIDPDKCIECGACAGTCPVGAPAQA